MFKQISSNNPALWFRYNDLPIKSNIVSNNFLIKIVIDA